MSVAKNIDAKNRALVNGFFNIYTEQSGYN